MTLAASGTLDIEPNTADPTRSIASEFGGTAPYDLENYYRGGALVLNTPNNSRIPTNGQINMEDFYGSSAENPVSVPDGIVQAISTSGANAFASIRFLSNGNVSGFVSPGGIPGTFNDWLIFGVSLDFEIRATVISGVTPDGSVVDTFLSLGSTLIWSIENSSSGNIIRSFIRFEIRASGSTIILSSGDISLTAGKV